MAQKQQSQTIDPLILKTIGMYIKESTYITDYKKNREIYFKEKNREIYNNVGNKPFKDVDNSIDDDVDNIHLIPKFAPPVGNCWDLFEKKYGNKDKKQETPDCNMDIDYGI